MENLEKYNFYISNLPEDKVIEDNYTLGKDFFLGFPNDYFSNGNFEIMVKIKRKDKDITIELIGKGTIEVSCDRCLFKFPIEINIDETFFVKQTDEEVTDSGIIVIKENKNIFNIADIIYQTIVFSIPLRNIHPLDENGKSTCNEEMINQLNKYLIN